MPNSADPSTAGRVYDPRDHATPADAVAVGPCAPAIPLNADVLLVEVRGTASGRVPQRTTFRQLLINRDYTHLPSLRGFE